MLSFKNFKVDQFTESVFYFQIIIVEYIFITLDITDILFKLNINFF